MKMKKFKVFTVFYLQSFLCIHWGLEFDVSEVLMEEFELP